MLHLLARRNLYGASMCICLPPRTCLSAENGELPRRFTAPMHLQTPRAAKINH